MDDDTLLVEAGADVEMEFDIVNPAVSRASTVLFPTLDAFNKRHDRRYTGSAYGIHGTPTNFALAEAVTALEGGHRTLVVSSGLAAVTLSLLAFLDPGDHLLMVDTVYGPGRSFCENILRRFGVEFSYYDPLIGDRIGSLMRPNTRVVYLESPGSLTFEVQDVPAIATEARARGAKVLLDNTWATPLYFKGFQHGVDVSIHAATKYISGHSDLVLGLIVSGDDAAFRKIKDTAASFGDCAAPDVCYLALRGLRTLSVRLRHHQQSALRVAQWLQGRPEIARVLYPALPDDPGHALWKRDFRGAAGLFGVVLRTDSERAVAAMVDGLALFRIGASWGGFESLIVPAQPGIQRTAVPWREGGYLVRINVGLEAVDDLIADLEAGLARLNQALRAAG